MKVVFNFDTKKGVPDIDWHRIKRTLKNKYPNTKNFTANIKPVLASKTYSQLRYFHSDGFLGRIVEGYRDAGYDVPAGTKAAKEWVKFQIKTNPDIMYVKYVKNYKSNQTYILPKSFSDISKKEMSSIIDWCFRKYQTYFDIILETAEEYKRRMGYK